MQLKPHFTTKEEYTDKGLMNCLVKEQCQIDMEKEAEKDLMLISKHR